MVIDKKVLERLKNGDEQAFELIYHAYSGRIYGFLHSSLGNYSSAAEDLLQTFFLKLWEARFQIDFNKDFNSYLFTIARHLVYKELHTQLTKASVSLLEEIDLEDNNLADYQLEAQSLKSYIDDLLNDLPSARREIFVLSRFHYLSNKEIAKKLSISEKTVETQIYRSIKYLKDKVKSTLILFISFNC